VNAWIEVEEPASARAYLESVLAAGLGLSTWLRERYRVERGALDVLVPEGMRLPPEVNFRESLAAFMGKGTRPPLRSEAKHAVALHILSTLAVGNGAFLVVEDPYALPGDPVLARYGSSAVAHDGHIYHVLFGQRCELPELESQLRMIPSWPVGIAAVCRIAGRAAVVDTASGLLARLLSEEGGSALAVLITAFDDEGHLLWRPESERGR